MDTPEGIAVQKVLDEQVNPGVAGHGGHISLVDVADNTAYIRLEGGCQGCVVLINMGTECTGTLPSRTWHLPQQV